MSKEGLPEYKYHGLLRLMLALFVLWSHSFIIFFPSQVWFLKLELGNAAVSIFFVISGYLMLKQQIIGTDLDILNLF